MHNYKRKRRKIAAYINIMILLMIVLSQSSGEEGVYCLPRNIDTISEMSFYNNTSLRSVILPDGIRKIDSLAFAYSSIIEINMPSSVSEIADDAFEGCSGLKTFTAEEGSYAYEWGREHGYLPRYKALLIGEKTFLRSYSSQVDGKDATYYKLEYASRNEGDIKNMAGMLTRVCGIKDEGDFHVISRVDLGYEETRESIITTFSGSADQDVSIIFIATHGLSAGDGDLEMAFTGSIDSLEDIRRHNQNTHLDFSTLAQWISQYVKGEVIIILESCGSGSSIYSSDVEQNSTLRKTKKQDYDPELFTEAAIRAFAEADDGLPIKEGTLTFNSTGDFRVPRFYVLASARHHEDSWGENESVANPQNYFTRWLIEGVGSRDNSPADSDRDNRIGLNEIYEYVKRIGNNYPFTYNGNIYYQHVQCYPLSSRYNLFCLK